MLKRAIFLDRDGTINEEVHYLHSVDKLRVIDGVPEALRGLKQAGFFLAVITNQAGIAKGYYSYDAMHAVHHAIQERVGHVIDRFVFCPHHPEGVIPDLRVVCSCRKPGDGMLTSLAAEARIDLTRSYVVGDKWIDVEAGRRAGCTTVLVKTGYGSSELQAGHATCVPDFVAEDLPHAAEWIMARERSLSGKREAV